MDATLPPPSTEPPARRVGGRFRVDAPIGKGAFGSVWRGVDEASGAAVAVKFLEPETSLDLARVRKEVAALRLLRVPGVVELLDAGSHEGRHYLVMELVDGLPFPGEARGWEALAPLVARLCETLRRIHAHGVVHRDLKPSNVLVTTEGRVVVLDFGIARGAALGSTVTGSADIVGTPLYLAPEQIHREGPVDGRADLYALGLMIYEALAGRRAFSGRTAQELMIARLTRDAPPLEDAPEGVARLVAALLARRPEDRPDSADAVLAAIAEGEARELPWLGSRAPVDALVAAARAGRSATVWGPPGSGRSRVLREAGETLRLEREVISLVSAERPLGSLAPLLDGVGADAPMAAAEERLRAALERGAVVIADDAARLDRWTRALLDRLRAVGVVLRVALGGEVRLEGVSASDLQALFHGPDVVLHLREDAAHALWQRTGGVPARIAEEVRAWVARGDARWDEGRLRVDRRAIDAFAAGPALLGGRASDALEEPLDALLAWVVLGGLSVTPELLVAATGLPAWEIDAELDALEEVAALRRLPDGRLQALMLPRTLGRWSDAERADAHRRLANALPGAAPDRLLHLAAAGDTDAIEGAAVTFARSLLDTGAAGRALAALQYAVGEVRAARSAVSPAVATELARAALVDGSGPALREARLTLERVGAEDVARLVGAWEAAGERRYAEAVALVAGLGVYADPELEAWRVALPIRVAVATDLEEAERLIGGLDVAEGSVVGRRRNEWLGHLRYRQGRYEEAAGLHMRAAEVETSVARRANSLINAGLAWRDGDRLDEAVESFNAARNLASGARLAAIEAHAVIGLRSTQYRLGVLGAANLEIVGAARTLGDPRLLAAACLNEAAAAWRSGDMETTAMLAKCAAEAWASPSTLDGWVLATALACAARLDVEGARALLPLLDQIGPVHRIQARALLRGLGLPAGTETLGAIRPPAGGRFAILTLSEVLR